MPPIAEPRYAVIIPNAYVGHFKFPAHFNPLADALVFSRLIVGFAEGTNI